MAEHINDLEYGKFDEVSTTGKFSIRCKAVDSTGGLITNSNPAAIKIVDTYGHNTVAAVDPLTASLAIIEVEHGELHAGRLWSYSSYTDLANGGSATFLFKAPATAKQTHLNFQIDFEVEGEVEVYYNPTITANGTQITSIFNRNLGSTNTVLSTIYTAPSLSSNGTLIINKRVGSNKAYGGDARGNYEIIIPSGKSLYIIVYNRASGATNLANWQVDWYEVNNF